MRRLIFSVMVSGLVVASWGQPAAAQRPVLVTTTPTVIQDPEASTTHYGHLSGQPAVFVISSAVRFTLVVDLLVPAPATPPLGLKTEVARTNELGANILLSVIEPSTADWQTFYEPYGGNTYWQAPAYRQDVDPGTYQITVSSRTNTEAYVLAVGHRSTSPVTRFVQSLATLPTIQSAYFGRPAWMFLVRGLVGTVVISLVALILIIIGLVIWRRRSALQEINRQADIIVEHRDDTRRW